MRDITDLAQQWSLAPGVTYLNHGSFGPAPRPVIEARQNWFRELERNPVDFYVRRLAGLLADVRERLGRFVGCSGNDLILVDNATWGMNLVAASVPLAAGDEVLLTNHEYGAVERIWERRCREVGVTLVIQPLPNPLGDVDRLVSQLFAAASPRTRLLVVSHITSPTAVILPIEAICREARRRGIAVCVDGPHALLQAPVNIAALDCDYYLASCHKWLCAPLGTGMMYVHPRVHAQIRPVILSWGRQFPGNAEPGLNDEFTWLGTRDPSGFLTIPAAIEFMEAAGVERFREHSHALAQQARRLLRPVTGIEPLVPDDSAWYGSMVAMPLPDGDGRRLQRALWERYQIEVPITRWRGGRLIRPSCHFYTKGEQLELLASSLAVLLAEGL
ncbi:MAG: aminotransferase class V-fold PLP-dependent enzyme [Planctomycetes bacterium]|nr:aminotransferase class V-fold PLP-dependent enzyme [Planctomycetota bacterium]